MLKLLPCPLFVTIRNGPIVDLLHVWESVHNEGPQQHSVAHLVSLNGQAHQIGEGLQLGDLNEAVDVIVLEEQTFQLLESL